MPNRIRDARIAKGWTQTDLAKRAGTNQPTVDRLERGETLNSKHLGAILEALGLSGGSATVPVLGHVGAGFEVFPLSEGETLDDVDAPPNATPTTVAVRVTGDSMRPAYGDGDIIFYDRQENGNLDHLIGRECVVQAKDGRCFVKRLHRGTSRNLWMLISYSADPIEVEVEWAARVKWVLKA